MSSRQDRFGRRRRQVATPRRRTPAPAWLSDRTPLRAPYLMPLLGAGGAWQTGHRRYFAGWPLRLVPPAPAARSRPGAA